MSSRIWCRLILIGTITFYSHSTTCSHWHPKPMHFSTLAGSLEDHTCFTHRLSAPYAAFRNPKQQLSKLSPMQWKLCHFIITGPALAKLRHFVFCCWRRILRKLLSDSYGISRYHLAFLIHINHASVLNFKCWFPIGCFFFFFSWYNSLWMANSRLKFLKKEKIIRKLICPW